MARVSLITTDYIALAFGEHLAEIPAWGEPGFVDPQVGDDSQGWFAWSYDGAADLTLGYGSDGQTSVELDAASGSALISLQQQTAVIVGQVDTGMAQLRVHAQTAQTAPLLRLQDESATDVWTMHRDGHGLLGALGPLLADIPAWGVPGLVSSAALDSSKGWLAFDLADAADLTVGYGADGGTWVEATASTDGSIFSLGRDGDEQVRFSTRNSDIPASFRIGPSDDPHLRFGVDEDFGGSPYTLIIGPNLVADAGGWVALGRSPGTGSAFIQLGQDDGSAVIAIDALSDRNRILVQAVTAQSTPLLDLQDEGGTTVFSVLPDGTFDPPLPGGGAFPITLDDASATYTITATGNVLTAKTILDGSGDADLALLEIRAEATDTARVNLSTGGTGGKSTFLTMGLNGTGVASNFQIDIDGTTVLGIITGALNMQDLSGGGIGIGNSAFGAAPANALALGDRGAGLFLLGTIPTSDPHVVNQVWNDAGVLTLSAG